MKMGSLLAVAGLALAFTAAPVTAQQSQDCRCVDRDGNEIENCSCFRAPRFEGLGQAFAFSASRPRLGVSVDPQQSARRDAVGALVTDVLENGPADEAGVRRGDLITSIDGQSLLEPLDEDVEEDFDLDDSIPVQRLLAITRDLEPGEQVEVEYVRDDETYRTTVEAENLSEVWGRESFAVVAPEFDRDRLRGQLRILREGTRWDEPRTDVIEDLAERIRDQTREWSYSFTPEGGNVRFYEGDAGSLVFDRFGMPSDGLELVELNPSLGSYFGAEQGVLVADVSEDSSLGLQPGDVILSVGDRPVTSPEHVRRILRSYDSTETISFQIRREGDERMVTGQLGG